jgi:hypothetical protein
MHAEGTMKRRRLLWAGGILAGLLVGVPVLLWSGYAALALMRHEHFYHGLPSSWWRRQFTWRRGYHEEDGSYSSSGYERFDRLSRSWIGPVTNYLGISQPPNGFAIFSDPAAAPVLCDLIRDGEVDTRLVAAECLARMQLHLEVVMPALIAELEKNQPRHHYRERLFAMSSLGRFGQQAAPAVPALLTLLNRKTRETDGDAQNEQHMALQTLCQIDPDNMELLIRLLEHPNRGIRESAVRTLGYQFGPKAKAAVPALVKMITERQKREYLGLYRAAALALLRIDPEAAHKAGVPKGYE